MNFDWTTGSLGASLGAGLSIPITQSYGEGGSNSANAASASGASTTEGTAAREWSAKQAEIAYERQKELMKTQMEYNSREARLARQWQEDMANTVYTRSVANMREAGINPILAANMGLSGAQVGSGQTASIAGASAPMAQSFADSNSAWQSQSNGASHSWQNSESGIATAIEALANLASSALGAINAGNTLNVFMNEAKEAITDFAKKGNPAASEMDKSDYGHSYEKKKTGNWLVDGLYKGLVTSINGLQHTTGGGYNVFR